MGRTNIFIFHGTGGYPEENWFPWLRGELEKEGYNVTIPQFPTPENQTPKEWFKVLDEYRDKIDEDTILIGHSLGGSFLLRVLEKLNSRIKASFLVGTPIGISPIVNWSGDEPFTGHPYNWEKIRENGGRFFVFHSDNDPYVGLKNGQKLAENLQCNLLLRKGAGHFNKKAGFTEFPELLENILLIK